MNQLFVRCTWRCLLVQCMRQFIVGCCKLGYYICFEVWADILHKSIVFITMYFFLVFIFTKGWSFEKAFNLIFFMWTETTKAKKPSAKKVDLFGEDEGDEEEEGDLFSGKPPAKEPVEAPPKKKVCYSQTLVIPLLVSTFGLSSQNCVIHWNRLPLSPCLPVKTDHEHYQKR